MFGDGCDGDRRHGRLQVEGFGNGVPESEVARGEDIGVAETEQQIDVSRPRSNAMNLAEPRVRLLGGKVGQRVEIETGTTGRGDRPQRLDLGCGEARLPEARVAGTANGHGRQIRKGFADAVPDGPRACDRQLLADNDTGETGEPRFAATERQRTGNRRHRLQPPVALHEMRQTLGEVVRRRNNPHIFLIQIRPGQDADLAPDDKDGEETRLMQPVFRFAPSPNGYLHLGHALSAMVNHDRCRAAGGRFLLRIEDIDGTRCRPEYETAIYEDLAWLGLDWEEPVQRQSDHMPAYAQAVARLTDIGLIYPAFLSRAQIAEATASGDWPRDPDGAPLYPGTDCDLDPEDADRRIAAGQPYALRLRMAQAIAAVATPGMGPLGWEEAGEGFVAADPAAWGDVILARRETPTSYHLSVVLDDAAAGVTHVVRGRDLYHATSIHVLLQRLFGLPSPAYHHHRLIVDANGRKLSKSDGDTALRDLRQAGATPADIRRMVGL